MRYAWRDALAFRYHDAMTRGNSNPKRWRTAIRKAARKTGKWGGAVVTVLLLVVWVMSAWWYAGFQSHWNRNEFDADAHNGTVGIVWGRPDDAPGAPFIEWEFDLTLDDRGGPLWFRLRGEWYLRHDGPPLSRDVTYVMFPIWFPLVIVLTGTSLVWRADLRAMRRAREGLCAACGYDLAGTAAGAVCPECGRGDTQRAQRTIADSSAPSGQSGS